MKKIVFVGFFWLLFIGCIIQSSKTYAVEIWNDVKSIDELAGRWAGSFSVNIPPNIDASMPGTSMEMTFTLEHIRNSSVISVFSKIDFASILTDWSNEIEAMGLTKDSYWELLLGAYESDGDIINVGKYYITIERSEELGTLGAIFSSEDGKIQINESRNKLRFAFYEALSLEPGDPGLNEVILTLRECCKRKKK
ncbi:MAG: hypothetical protein LBU70_10465 [Chitinispirillales bacterium]|jgi:hypothetical protein|nr:hypothetical protein [Chitinispirillales bacterium]